MEAPVVFTAKKETVVRLAQMKSENGWYKIFISKNQTGWIHGNTVEFAEDGSGSTKLPGYLLDESVREIQL